MSKNDWFMDKDDNGEGGDWPYCFLPQDLDMMWRMRSLCVLPITRISHWSIFFNHQNQSLIKIFQSPESVIDQYFLITRTSHWSNFFQLPESVINQYFPTTRKNHCSIFSNHQNQSLINIFQSPESVINQYFPTTKISHWHLDSWGPGEISWSEGMYNPFHPISRHQFIPTLGMYQEIHPHRAWSIDNVKINISLLKEKKMTITEHISSWKLKI